MTAANGQWEVLDATWIPDDRMWKVIVVREGLLRTVYFPVEKKIGEFLTLRG